MLSTRLSPACKHNGYHTDRGSLKIAQPHPPLSVLCLDTCGFLVSPIQCNRPAQRSGRRGENQDVGRRIEQHANSYTYVPTASQARLCE